MAKRLAVAANVVWKKLGCPGPAIHTRMVPDGIGNDRWVTSVVADSEGLWTFRVDAWADPWSTWLHNVHAKLDAGQDALLQRLFVGAVSLGEVGEAGDDLGGGVGLEARALDVLFYRPRHHAQRRAAQEPMHLALRVLLSAQLADQAQDVLPARREVGLADRRHQGDELAKAGIKLAVVTQLRKKL